MKEEWANKKLGDIASFESGSRPTGGVGQLKEGVLSLGGEHIGRNGRIDLSSAKYVSREYYNSNTKGRISEGDILLCKDGALTGKVAIERGELHGVLSMVNEHVFVIRTNVVSQWYLFYYLFSPIGQSLIRERITGSAQGGINGTQLKTIPVPYPKSFQDQKRIVSELDLLYSLIDKQQAQLKELDNLAQSIFYDMFGDPVENDKGWKYVSLNELIEKRIIVYHLDGNHGSEYPRSEEFVERGVPYIGANSISNGLIDFSLAKYLTEERVLTIKKGIAKNDDVLFAHNATVGPVALLKTLEEKVILSTSLTAYRCNKDKLLPYFLKSYMESPWFVCQYKKTMKQTTRNQVPITKQREMLFILPPLSLQQLFVKKIEAIEKQKARISESIAETQKLFDYTMDKYFG